MLHIMGIRTQAQIGGVFEIANLVELAEGFIAVAEPDRIGRRHTVRTGKNQLAPADRRDAGSAGGSVQLLQYRHASLDIVENRFGTLLGPTDPFNQQRLFEFALLFQLPHERSRLFVQIKR